MNTIDSKEWIPCDKQMPDGTEDEILCLVTCKEWDIFDGKWGEREVRIVSYSTIAKKWNTKSDIIIEAWRPLPMPYVK